MPYGSWTKAQTIAERLKQRREKRKWNTTPVNSWNESQNPPDDPKSKTTELQTPNQNEKLVWV